MKYVLILGSALFTASCSANVTAPINSNSTENRMSQFLADFLPTHYQKVHEQPVPIDSQHVQWLRFQKSPSFTLGEENFSYLSDPAHNLKGFSYLDANLIHGSLPSKVQAQKIADDFLQLYAPDLLKNRKIQWIEQHDENIQLNGNNQKISGMKIKMRNLNDGRWFWVIVGKNQRPIIFERDIVWIDFPGHRKTEKWLHDSWLKDKPTYTGQAK
jgi:hypothetical protein